jgi:hypothetical protein
VKKTVFALFALLLAAVPAAAQHSHGSKGANGGPMEDAAGVHVELVTSGDSLVFHVTNESGNPVSTKGFTGSVLLVSGGARETITLAPSGESALAGQAKAPIAAGAQITLQLKTDAGKSGQARFKK